jgi:hypothetical protein
MKKYILIVSSILSLCLLFTACSNVDTNDAQTELVKECLTSYFSYYEKGDFDNMKQYCNDDFVDEYFHSDDVFANASAELIDLSEINYDNETQQYKALVYVKCVPTPDSSLYDKDNPEQAVYTYVSYILCVENGNAEIVGLTTE